MLSLCWGTTSWRSVSSSSAASFILEHLLEDRLWRSERLLWRWKGKHTWTLIYFTRKVYRVNQCYYNVWGWLVYQNQFSYSSNSSGLCSLLIYSAFQQYITKNVGLCGTGSYSGFKFIRTMRQVKEEEKMLIPSIVPSFCLLNTSCSPCLVSFHVWFMWGFRGRTNGPFYAVQFKVWQSTVPALWQCYHKWPSFAIPSSGDELMHDGGSRADSEGLNRAVDRGLDSSLNCTFCSLVSPPSILDIRQERIGSWCSHPDVQMMDVL